MCSSQGCDQELSTLEEALQDARQALPECPTLLVAASMLCVYRQMTEDTSDLPLTGFLATILLSMLPLMALKAIF